MRVCFVLIFKFQSLLWLCIWVLNLSISSATANILVKWIAFVSLNCCVFANTFQENATREKASLGPKSVSLSNSWPWCICALRVMKVGAEAVEIFPNYSSLIDSLVLLWAERHLHTSLKLGAPKTVMNKRDMICPLGFRSSAFSQPVVFRTVLFRHILNTFINLSLQSTDPQTFLGSLFFKPNYLAILQSVV